ncbi:conserved hypothetical protein [Sphingomonas aurantiaca]|uniref:Uncharacterized protein n=1 Tax=Sphingomonas aurantiaca TaxID=185949 RepID=A0A5E8A0J6_9SPHN|nr:conserved hypothetical protein [Sphingomonas aurantiaca]
MLFWICVALGVIWGGTFIAVVLAAVGSHYSQRIRRIFYDD